MFAGAAAVTRGSAGAGEEGAGEAAEAAAGGHNGAEWSTAERQRLREVES